MGKLSEDIKIYAVAHKEFELPMKNPIYCPILVGEAHELKMASAIKDNTGENIADRNDKYNEITALYWIWKNAEPDIVGICHYRRYFTSLWGKIDNLLSGKIGDFLTEKRILRYLTRYDIIVHNKTFFVQGNLAQLIKNDQKGQVENEARLSREIVNIMNEVFCELYPQEKQIYEKVMRGKTCHLLNMMICKKEILNQYCEWLFPLLFKIEERIEKEVPRDNARCLGLIAERLLDVWIKGHEVRVKECFTINTERKDWKIW